MSLTFCSLFNSVGVFLQRFTWCLLLYEHWAFWLRVLTAECTLKFHKLRMAEYLYRTSLVTECLPSNSKHPLQLTKQFRWVQWQIACLQATRTSCYTHHHSQPSGEREDCPVFLLIFRNRLWIVDGRAHSKFHRLQISDFFYAIKQNITTGDITYITSFGVWVLDIRFITPW